MLDVFNIPTVQGGTNYQEFYGGGTTRDWVKPRGASMVRFMLIGPGGGGADWIHTSFTGGGSGGSGAITQWIGPAIFIPDVLQVFIGAGGVGNSSAAAASTTITYQQKDGTGYTLLTARGGTGSASNAGGAGGSASANNYFGASGIYANTVGNNGRNVDVGGSFRGASFLIAGAPGTSQPTVNGGYVEGSFGYPDIAGGLGTVGGNGRNGYFITQPFFLGFGGSGGGGSTGPGAGGNGGNGGIGCGGGGAGRSDTARGFGGRGGDGAVFVWAW
jgi:hypothetical protein